MPALVPGKTDSPTSAIIDARSIPDAIDAVGLLAGSPAWKPADTAAMVTWFTAYFDWLQNSPNGRAEANTVNNHANYYDQQVVSIALFLGKDDVARGIIETAKTRRIAAQIQADGKQPFELKRAHGLSYSFFNLTALVELAEMAENLQIDLWHYTAPNGASLQAATDYLIPFVSGSPATVAANLEGIDPETVRLPFLLASIHLGDPKYAAITARLAHRATPMRWFLQRHTQSIRSRLCGVTDPASARAAPGTGSPEIHSCPTNRSNPAASQGRCPVGP